MLEPGRQKRLNTVDNDGYRFGYQGQEKDDEITGVTGSHLSFKYRIYDSRTGRFYSPDPLNFKYPYLSSYAFAENSPIAFGELEGLERYFAADGTPMGQIGKSNQIRVLDEYGVKNFASYYSGKMSNSELINSHSTPYHSSSESAQAAISGRIYTDVINSHISLKTMEICKECGSSTGARTLGVGKFDVNPDLQKGSAYLMDDYFNQINIWFHEEFHNVDKAAGGNRAKNSGRSFEHFIIAKRQFNHWSYKNTTPEYKTWLKGVMKGYLDSQSQTLSQYLFDTSNKEKLLENKTFQYYLNAYNANVEFYNEAYGEDEGEFPVDFFLGKEEGSK